MYKENVRRVGRPRSFNNSAELWDLLQEYIRTWESKKRPLTIIGMALFVGVCRDTLHQYEKGVYDTEEEKYSDTIKNAKMYIEMDKWEALLSGRYEKTAAIFDLKVNHKCVEYEKTMIHSNNEEEVKQEEEIIDLNKIDYSEYTDEELRTMAEYRKILNRAITKEGK